MQLLYDKVVGNAWITENHDQSEHAHGLYVHVYTYTVYVSMADVRKYGFLCNCSVGKLLEMHK